MRGNRDAFSPLVERYEKTVFAVCMARLSQVQEAENAAQETFLSAYRGLALYGGGSLKGWLCRIAMNKCNDFHRKKKHVELVDIEETELISPEASPEALAIAATEREALLTLIQTLPPDYQTALRGYYFEEKSVRELAQQEQIPFKTMETRVYRGLRMLRERKGALLECARPKKP